MICLIFFTQNLTDQIWIFNTKETVFSEIYFCENKKKVTESGITKTERCGEKVSVNKTVSPDVVRGMERFKGEEGRETPFT